ncbi:DoxX family protein [Nonomuraea sp. NPDC003201]
MKIVSLPPLQPFAPLGPLIVRVVTGATMIAHGFHFTPTEFGQLAQQAFDLPFPGLIGWGAVLLQVVGGGMFVLGLLSRLVAIPSIVHMAMAIFMWEMQYGFAPKDVAAAGSVGVQLPLLIMAGYILVLLAGPGPVSLDRLLGWDNGWEQGSRSAQAHRADRAAE